MPSLPEQLGLSEEEWNELDPDVRQRMAVAQGKLLVQKQMVATGILRDDQAALMRRQAAVEKQILGRDANNCDDTPLESSDETPMEIHSLGDVVIGDQALAALSKQKIDQSVNQNTQPPPPQPQPQPHKPGSRIPKWLLPIAGIAIGSGLTFAAARYFSDNGGGDSPQNRYDSIAVPYYPTEP